MSTRGWPVATMATTSPTGLDKCFLSRSQATETMSGGYGHNDSGGGRRQKTELSDGFDARQEQFCALNLHRKDGVFARACHGRAVKGCRRQRRHIDIRDNQIAGTARQSTCQAYTFSCTHIAMAGHIICFRAACDSTDERRGLSPDDRCAGVLWCAAQ
jgi:hypothetical protein